MAEIRPFTPQKLVVPAILASEVSAPAVCAALSDALGPTTIVGEAIPFTYTNYYEPEMGADLFRWFFAVQELIDPATLADRKVATDEIERRFAVAAHDRGVAGSVAEITTAGDHRCRRVNLDPGLLSLSRLILASTKDFSHRIPLRDGIYAEVTLLYTKGHFQALPWTFPDYRTEEYQKVLLSIREIYHQQLRDRN